MRPFTLWFPSKSHRRPLEPRRNTEMQKPSRIGVLVNNRPGQIDFHVHRFDPNCRSPELLPKSAFRSFPLLCFLRTSSFSAAISRPRAWRVFRAETRSSRIFRISKGWLFSVPTALAAGPAGLAATTMVSGSWLSLPPSRRWLAGLTAISPYLSAIHPRIRQNRDQLSI